MNTSEHCYIIELSKSLENLQNERDYLAKSLHDTVSNMNLTISETLSKYFSEILNLETSNFFVSKNEFTQDYDNLPNETIVNNQRELIELNLKFQDEVLLIEEFIDNASRFMIYEKVSLILNLNIFLHVSN